MIGASDITEAVKTAEAALHDLAVRDTIDIALLASAILIARAIGDAAGPLHDAITNAAANDRIVNALGALGAEHTPREGWQDRVNREIDRDPSGAKT